MKLYRFYILKEKKFEGLSLKDIEAVFKATDRIKGEDKQIDFFFNSFDNLDNEAIMDLWDIYLNESIQTGISSGIDSAIGFNRWHGYSTELEEQ